jgi:uncharacterized repeat protein (TIGR02543 family)
MKKRRILCNALALILCLSLLPGWAGAASSPAAYGKMSSSYKSGPYYTKLMNVQLTGNQITDLIAVAASQLGYHESNSKSDLSGNAASSCKGNYTEYGNFTGANGAAWCASFVSWCFREAGIPTSIMPTSAGVGKLRRSVYNNGATWHAVDSGYTPKAGDLVLYESMGGNYSYYKYASRDSNGVPSSSSHVGIVVSDFDSATKTYCVIDGNGNKGSVKYLTNQKLYMAGPTKGGGTMNRIQGFVTPAYTTGSGASYDGSKVDTSVTVSLTVPSNPAYTAKQSVSDTNATVVTRITKTAGSAITQSGILLSAADGTLIKKHTENVTNVSNSTTTFHAWYDIQKELGVPLSPGTTYRYQFFAVVNGKTFLGNTYTFRTTGSSTSYTVTFDPGEGTVSPSTMTVRTNDVYGALPIPQRAGYSFLGWYTASSGGTLVTSTTNVLKSGGSVLYALWTDELEEELDASSGAGEAGITFTREAPASPETVASISRTNPVLPVTLHKPAGQALDQVGLRIYDTSGDLVYERWDDASGADPAKTSLSLTYRIADSVLGKLETGESYYYIYLVYLDSSNGGGEVMSDGFHFRLTDTAAASGTTVYFDGNGGSVSADSRTFTAGAAYGSLPAAVRTGYIFGGWYTARSGGSQVTSSTLCPTGNHTLYAHWTSDALPEKYERVVTLQIGSPYMTVDGVWQTIDDLGTAPMARNNRTMLPIRAVVEGLGGTVDWDGEKQMVTLELGGRPLYLQLGVPKAWDGTGDYRYLDSPPFAQNGRTFLPIRAIMEYYGATVEWDGDTQTVTITYQP